MKIAGNQFRPGNVLEYHDRIWKVVKTQAVKTGKSGAYAQIEMKDLVSGTKLNERFRASEMLERVRLDQKSYTFLFKDGSQLTFMDSETYEQIEVDAEFLGEQAAFLADGMSVELESYNEKIISVQLPAQIEADIAETEPTIKGRTVTSSYKPAVLDNGVRVMVPEFIKQGDRIIVDTATCEYVKRT